MLSIQGEEIPDTNLMATAETGQRATATAREIFSAFMVGPRLGEEQLSESERPSRIRAEPLIETRYSLGSGLALEGEIGK